MIAEDQAEITAKAGSHVVAKGNAFVHAEAGSYVFAIEDARVVSDPGAHLLKPNVDSMIPIQDLMK